MSDAKTKAPELTCELGDPKMGSKQFEGLSQTEKEEHLRLVFFQQVREAGGRPILRVQLTQQPAIQALASPGATIMTNPGGKHSVVVFEDEEEGVLVTSTYKGKTATQRIFPTVIQQIDYADPIMPSDVEPGSVASLLKQMLNASKPRGRK